MLDTGNFYKKKLVHFLSTNLPGWAHNRAIFACSICCCFSLWILEYDNQAPYGNEEDHKQNFGKQEMWKLVRVCRSWAVIVRENEIAQMPTHPLFLFQKSTRNYIMMFSCYILMFSYYIYISVSCTIVVSYIYIMILLIQFIDLRLEICSTSLITLTELK